MEFELYDVVQVVDAEHKRFIGEKGIILDIDENYEYPYEVLFFEREVRTLAKKLRIDFWRGNELEGV